MSVHVAVDIGASSGRVIVAEFEDNRFEVNEVHRFKNGFHQVDGHDRWNIDELFENILIGLAKVKERGIAECTLGIDTWAVDYVLVKDGEKLGHPIAYRDSRTQKGVENVFAKISKEDLYSKTGIQFLPFNTMFQYASEEKEVLQNAEKSLLIPDYLAYQLTGVMVAEETNASTTQLLNPHHKKYDVELLEIAGLEAHQLPELVAAGTYIGDVTDALRAAYDLPLTHVYAVATHDTASAVVGVPATDEHFAYISSGTWSLIGVHYGDYIATGEEGTLTYISQKDIEESYVEVKPNDKRTRFATFDGYFSTIMSFLDEANRKCGYDRYEYYCYTSPSASIKVYDNDSGTKFSLVEGDVLVIGKGGTLLEISKEEYEHE